MVTAKQSVANHPSSQARDSLARELTASAQELNAANAEFLRIDVQTALTFAGLAMTTGNEEKKKRNRKNARKAYDTILGLWNSVHLTPSQEAYLHERMIRLKNQLELLGERF